MKFKILILSILLFVFSGCMAHVKPIDIPDLKIEATEMPSDDILNKITEMKTTIGPAPVPKVIIQNGITYYGFTQEQLHQLTAKNELGKYLEETVNLQQERVKVLVMEINSLKRLVELKKIEAESFQRLYVNAKNEVIDLRNENVLGGIVYKIIMIGQTIAIILLI